MHDEGLDWHSMKLTPAITPASILLANESFALALSVQQTTNHDVTHAKTLLSEVVKTSQPLKASLQSLAANT